MANRTTLLPETPVATVAEYVAGGGGRGLERARTLGADAVIDEVTEAGLRGRGGAGFPTGRKWRSLRELPGAPKFAVCNAAEGEPGTFKDRAILRADPYQVVEGLAIAAFAIGPDEVFLALKASFERERDRVVRAAQELEAEGLLEDLTVTVVSGPEEYLFGEETALLEVIEGRDPLPRHLPPYVQGLFVASPQIGWHSHEAGQHGATNAGANPTLVNNVETLADVTHILAEGPEWFRSIGTAASPGPVLVTIVGDVRAPGVHEVEMGTPLGDVIDRCGGLDASRRVKAVFSGVTNRVLPGDRIDVVLTYEALREAGSGLGAAGFIVNDDTACMVDVADVFARFLWVESCGQCPACKIGTGRISDALDQLRVGTGGEAALRVLQHSLRIVTDGNRCFLPVEARQVVASILETFPDDVVAHLEGRCRSTRTFGLPKLTDLEAGVAVMDEHQAAKQPDWTYAA